MWWSKKQDYSTHQQYFKASKERKEGTTTLDDLVFTIVDTETTGFDPGRDHIISIGAVQVNNLSIEVEKTLELHFPYQITNDREHISVHQMTPKSDVLNNEIREEVDNFLSFIGASVLVGHHIAFDVKMLNHLISQHYAFTLFNETLDTALLAKRLEHGTDNSPTRMQLYSLDALCLKYGITPYDRHHAAGDAFLTAELLLKLLKNCTRKGIKSKRELLKKNLWL